MAGYATGPTLPRAVGYLRRSTDRQAQSINDQRIAVAQYADAAGVQMVEWYVDDAISGTSTTGRRAFQRMISDAQRRDRPFELIIVYDVKRFGRVDNDEAGYYRHLLRRHGVEIRYTSESFNGDGVDDLLRPVKQWQARQESKDLAKVTIRGLLSKLSPEVQTHADQAPSRNGWWMGGCPPYGYDLQYESADGRFLCVVRYLPDGSKQILDEHGERVRTLARGESLNASKNDRCRLVPSHPDRVEAVRWMFRMYADEGKGVRAVTEALNAAGIPTPRGPAWSRLYSGQWSTPTVRAILVNPLYVGDLAWNRRRDGRFYRISDGQAHERTDVHGARLVPNDRRDWVIVPDAHEPLVPRRLFERVQEQMKQRAGKATEPADEQNPPPTFRRWHGKRNRFMLSGLLHCAHCGSHYQGITRTKGKRRVDGSLVRTHYYGCGGYVNRGRSVCSLHPVRQIELETKVKATVLDYYRAYLGEDGRDRLAQACRDQLGQEHDELTEARQRIEDEQAQLKRTIDNLLDNLTETNREFIDQRLSELKGRQQDLAYRRDQLHRLELDQQRIASTVHDAMAFIEQLEHTFEHAVPQQQREALRRCLTEVRIDAVAGRATLSIRPVPFTSFGVVEQRHCELAPIGS